MVFWAKYACVIFFGLHLNTIKEFLLSFFPLLKVMAKGNILIVVFDIVWVFFIYILFQCHIFTLNFLNKTKFDKAPKGDNWFMVVWVFTIYSVSHFKSPHVTLVYLDYNTSLLAFSSILVHIYSWIKVSFKWFFRVFFWKGMIGYYLI
jgi:hypothetical protein